MVFITENAQNGNKRGSMVEGHTYRCLVTDGVSKLNDVIYKLLASLQLQSYVESNNCFAYLSSIKKEKKTLFLKNSAAFIPSHLAAALLYTTSHVNKSLETQIYG